MGRRSKSSSSVGAAKPAPSNVVPFEEPVITLATFARRFPRDPIIVAYQASERLCEPRVRKRTRAEWQADYDKFLRAPR